MFLKLEKLISPGKSKNDGSLKINFVVKVSTVLSKNVTVGSIIGVFKLSNNSTFWLNLGQNVTYIGWLLKSSITVELLLKY